MFKLGIKYNNLYFVDYCGWDHPRSYDEFVEQLSVYYNVETTNTTLRLIAAETFSMFGREPKEKKFPEIWATEIRVFSDMLVRIALSATREY